MMKLEIKVGGAPVSWGVTQWIDPSPQIKSTQSIPAILI